MHSKCFQITTKDYKNSWCYTLHSTFNQRTQTNTTSPKNFLKVLQLNANGICNKTDEIQLTKNTQADVITIQETKHFFTPIRTDCTYKQGGCFLTYITNNISFSQLNTSNTFLIELQIIKIHLSTSQKLHIANTYIPPSYHKQKI